MILLRDYFVKPHVCIPKRKKRTIHFDGKFSAGQQKAFTRMNELFPPRSKSRVDLVIALNKSFGFSPLAIAVGLSSPGYFLGIHLPYSNVESIKRRLRDKRPVNKEMVLKLRKILFPVKVIRKRLKKVVEIFRISLRVSDHKYPERFYRGYDISSFEIQIRNNRTYFVKLVRQSKKGGKIRRVMKLDKEEYPIKRIRRMILTSACDECFQVEADLIVEN